MHQHIEIDSIKQQLFYYQDKQLQYKYFISTGKNGMGEELGSEKTPRGKHIIYEKIGQNQPENTVFVARTPTGECYKPQMMVEYPQRDWILTRILRLKGLEEGKNLHSMVDTYERYIYIHGTPDETPLGILGSKGCIRMKNRDIIELFDNVVLGTEVFIK